MRDCFYLLVCTIILISFCSAFRWLREVVGSFILGSSFVFSFQIIFDSEVQCESLLGQAEIVAF